MLRRNIYWACAIIIAVVYGWLCITAGLSLPVPWPDESSFLWQSISLAQHGTLFAPELNASREVMWMPPGYMIVIGAMFKIFGASFVMARTVSLVFMIAAFALFAEGVRKFPFSFFTLAMLGLVFLSAPLIVTANTARMEAMVFFTGALSFFLFERRRDGWALAVAVLAPLIHPNGLYLLLAAIGYATTQQRWKEIASSKKELIPLAAAMLLWVMYAVHVASMWTAFRSDMSYQMLLKGANELPLLSVRNVMFFAACSAAIVYGWFRKKTFPLLVWYGAGLWFLYGMGTDAWYECYYGVAVVLLAGAVIPIIMQTSRNWFSSTQNSLWRNATAAVILAVMIVLGCGTVVSKNFYNQKQTGGWYGMRAEDAGVPYINAADKISVRKYLQSIQQQSHHVIVQFHPEADALFFADMETDSLRFCQGTFYRFTPDLYIIHSSRYIPPWWSEEIRGKLCRMGLGDAANVRVLIQRDSTEMVAAYNYR